MLDLLLSWWGVGGGIAALIAIAWFVPGLRHYALIAIAALGAAKYLERRGVDAERERQKEAERKLLEKVAKDRADAERDARDKRMRDKRDLDDA